MMTAPRVWIAYVGGTIGMTESGSGYASKPGHLLSLMRAAPELARAGVPEFVVEEREPLLDSADFAPADWLRIARDIALRADEFDGFVVLHGTDTMAYTASALSFLLRGLDKPVIVTGSQIPLSETRSDGWDNLITSLVIAGRGDIPEVCLYFGRRLLRGNRAVKVDAAGFGAFDSPAFPALGQAGVEISIHRELVLPPACAAGEQLELPSALDARLAVLRLFPGIALDFVEHVLRAPLEGIVLECYGAGTAATRDGTLAAALGRAVDRGVVAIAVSQCRRAGGSLARAGVGGGADLTTEAALTKLYALFARYDRPSDVREHVVEPLCGELGRAAKRS